MPNKSFIKILLERRIPQIIGSYFIAGTSLIFFIQYLVDKYQFPSHYSTLSLFGLIGKDTRFKSHPKELDRINDNQSKELG